MTLERSHGKPRLTLTRMRDVPEFPAAEPQHDRDARGRFRTGNGVGRGRHAKRALTASLRAVLTQAAGAALPEHASPQIGAQIAQHALTLYRSAALELGDVGVLARSHLIVWAGCTAMSSYLTAAAAAAGPESDRGLLLLDRAHVASARAERASIAALTTARALGGPRSPARNTVADHVLGGLDPDGDST